MLIHPGTNPTTRALAALIATSQFTVDRVIHHLAISKNYRRSVNTQIMICAHRRRVAAISPCWPGNRIGVIVARHRVTHLIQ